MNMHEIANRLAKANEQAEEILQGIRMRPDADRIWIEQGLQDYIARKLLLSEDEISDNIIEMVRINVAKASHMTVEELKEQDRPGVCGSAPAVLSKRVLLYLAIQKGLDITLPARETPSIRTIQDLTDMILPLLTGRNTISG